MDLFQEIKKMFENESIEEEEEDFLKALYLYKENESTFITPNYKTLNHKYNENIRSAEDDLLKSLKEVLNDEIFKEINKKVDKFKDSIYQEIGACTIL